MHVSCPMCNREYPVPEDVGRDRRFRCQCGCNVRLAELVDSETWARERPASGRALALGGLALVALGALVALRWRRPPPPPPVETPTPRVDRGETTALAGVDGQAERLARAGKHLEALRLYRSLADVVRAANADALREREDRLLTTLANELLAKASAAETPAQIRAIGPFAEEFLREWAPADHEVPALVELAGAIAALKERLRAPSADDAQGGGGAPSAHELPPEPASRVARFERLAEEGRKRIQRIRARIAQERRALREQRQAQVARLRERTRERPLIVPLSTGLQLEGATVEEFDLQTVRLKAPNQEVTLPWSQLPPRVAIDLRALAVRGRDASDQLEFGTWCLKHRYYDAATAAFRRAAQLDPALRAVVPDVELIRSRGQVFAGAYERRGNTVTVDYPFADPAEGADWLQIDAATQAAIQNDRLEVQGSDVFLVGLKEVGFEGHAEVTAAVGRSSRADAETCFGIRFARGTPRELYLVVAVVPATRDVVLYRGARGQLAPIARKREAFTGSRPRVTLRVRRRTVRVLVGNRAVLRLRFDPEWSDTQVVAGGFAPGQGAVSFDALQVEGRVRSAWLRKSFGEIDAALFGLLRRRDDLPIFTRPGEPRSEPLSAEDDYGLQALTGDREAYEAARPLTASYLVVEVRRAIAALDGVLRDSPRFAAAYYYRGLARGRLGEVEDALSDLSIAAALCPRFHEALGLKALVLTRRGKAAEGLRLAEQALAVRPDEPKALAARGIASFHRSEDQEAQVDLEVARAIDPWDEDVAGLARAVGVVIEGPPWQRRFRATTLNFDVQTNISQERADEYARHLEAIRAGLYAKVFDDDGEPRPPARVLVFDTPEGYYGYSELALDDRKEMTLGMYVPLYRQLLLFEDKDDEGREETLDTLYHEGFHQFLDQLIPDADVPNWLNEGLAEYFGATVIEGGEVRTGGLQLGRLQNLRWHAAAGQPLIPFQELMLEGHAEFYSGNVGLKYAQAWSMVHFFRKGASSDAKRRFLHYIRLIRQGQPRQAALAVAWSGVDWGALQQAWWKYVLSLPLD